MFMPNVKSFTVAAALVVGGIASSASAVLIDNFSSTQFHIATNNTSQITESGLEGVIGFGDRYALTERVSGRGGIEGNMDNWNNGGMSEAYVMTSGPGAKGKWTLAYGAGPSGQFDVDLTNAGQYNNVAVEFVGTDNDINVTVNIVTSGGVVGTQQLFKKAGNNGILNFMFTDFVKTSGSGSLDFTSVNQIEFIFSAQAMGGDYIAKLLESNFYDPDGPQPGDSNAIPSPAAVWAGLALIGSAIMRRRNR